MTKGRTWILLGFMVMFLSGAALVLVQQLAPMSEAEYQKFNRLVIEDDPTRESIEAFADEHRIGLAGWYLRPTQYHVFLGGSGLGLCLGLVLTMYGYMKGSKKEAAFKLGRL